MTAPSKSLGPDGLCSRVTTATSPPGGGGPTGRACWQRSALMKALLKAGWKGATLELPWSILYSRSSFRAGLGHRDCCARWHHHRLLRRLEFGPKFERWQFWPGAAAPRQVGLPPVQAKKSTHSTLLSALLCGKSIKILFITSKSKKLVIVDEVFLIIQTTKKEIKFLNQF